MRSELPVGCECILRSLAPVTTLTITSFAPLSLVGTWELRKLAPEQVPLSDGLRRLASWTTGMEAQVRDSFKLPHGDDSNNNITEAPAPEWRYYA